MKMTKTEHNNGRRRRAIKEAARAHRRTDTTPEVAYLKRVAAEGLRSEIEENNKRIEAGITASMDRRVLGERLPPIRSHVFRQLRAERNGKILYANQKEWRKANGHV
jgi:hypothetical protein